MTDFRDFIYDEYDGLDLSGLDLGEVLADDAAVEALRGGALPVDDPALASLAMLADAVSADVPGPEASERAEDNGVVRIGVRALAAAVAAVVLVAGTGVAATTAGQPFHPIRDFLHWGVTVGERTVSPPDSVDRGAEQPSLDRSADDPNRPRVREYRVGARTVLRAQEEGPGPAGRVGAVIEPGRDARTEQEPRQKPPADEPADEPADNRVDNRADDPADDPADEPAGEPATAAAPSPKEQEPAEQPASPDSSSPAPESSEEDPEAARTAEPQAEPSPSTSPAPESGPESGATSAPTASDAAIPPVETTPEAPTDGPSPQN